MTRVSTYTRRFRVGTMRDRVQLQAAVETIDSAGQTIRTWTTAYADQPAQRLPMRGAEGIRGGQVEAQIDEIFVIHHRDNVTPEMRLLHNSRVYGIVYVNPIDGRLRYLELSCKAVV